MSNLEVVNRVYVYEVDDKENEVGQSYPKIIISSHWNRDEFVVIEVGGHSYTVAKSDLRMAIDNAGNWK